MSASYHACLLMMFVIPPPMWVANIGQTHNVNQLPQSACCGEVPPLHRFGLRVFANTNRAVHHLVVAFYRLPHSHAQHHHRTVGDECSVRLVATPHQRCQIPQNLNACPEGFGCCLYAVRGANVLGLSDCQLIAEENRIHTSLKHQGGCRPRAVCAMMRRQRRLGAWWGRLPTAPTSVHPRRSISTSSPDAQTMASTCSTPGTTLSAASSWMGMSTPLHRAQKPLTKEDVEGLASMPLTHVVPSRVSDHVCIRLVRMLRWVADRLFRERLVHRALVLKCIASSPAAAGLVVEHVRCTLSSSQTSLGTSASPSPVATETQPRTVLPSKDVRRLLSNLGECQQAHMRMVLDLARLSFPERLALLLAQCVHCAVFSVVFALSRRAGFRLIGYLLEESSVMFTHMINDLDMEKLPVDTHSPGPAALRYWGLDPQFIVTEHTTSGTQSAQEPQAGGSVGKERVQTDADVRGGDSAIDVDAASATDPAPKDPNDDGDARVLLTLRDVALLMRADDMTYRDLVHAAATHMDVVRDQTASGGAPPTAFR